MYIKLIRNQPQGTAITGRLVIDGRYFCDTMERVGYQIPAICYPVRVTQSPKFKRLLPLVQNVPASPKSSPKGKDFNSDEKLPSLQGGAGGRLGIRFHRGTKPQHSTGCILVIADNATQPYTILHNSTPPQGRTAADVEQELIRLILKAQNTHEEIILEVIDFRPGTEYGYNTQCPPELQMP